MNRERGTSEARRIVTQFAEMTVSMSDWLLRLCVDGKPGWLRFCPRGNRIEPAPEAGLGASALGLKLAWQIGVWERLDNAYQTAWIERIRSFQSHKDGLFRDPTALAMVGPERREAMARAETRQAVAALAGVGATPRRLVGGLPRTAWGVRRHLRGLSWDTDPWGAGSHAGHMAFFLEMNRRQFGRERTCRRLLPAVLRFLDGVRQPETGSWHIGAVPANQAVNAAMKVLTVYRMLGRPVSNPESLIDLCLSYAAGRDACHRLDVLFVLNQCFRQSDHRALEVGQVAVAALREALEHRREDGALSFYADRANASYYGVPVSDGLQESDVHGSHLMALAVTLSAEILGLGDTLGWREPIT